MRSNARTIVFVFILLGTGLTAPVFANVSWYGPGSGINFTGWVNAWDGFGFSWPWGFLNQQQPYGQQQQQSNNPPLWNWVAPQSATIGTPLQFTVSARDPEGASLIYTASSVPQGASFDSTSHVFRWTPIAGQAGNYSVSFRAYDRVRSADMTVSITVSAQSIAGQNPYGEGYYQGYYGYGTPYGQYQQYQPPQISPLNSPVYMNPIPQQVVRVGERLTFQVHGYQAQGHYLRYNTGVLPQGARFDENSRTFTWTPTRMQVGQYGVNFRVQDGPNLYADQSASIIVLDQAGQLPYTACAAGPGPYTFGFIPPTSVRAGDLYSFQATASSGNINQVTFRVVDGPQGLTIGERTGYMRWVPAFNQRGTYAVRLGIYNGQCESVHNFNLTVY